MFSKARLLTTAALGGAACLIAKKLSVKNDQFLNTNKVSYAEVDLQKEEVEPVVELEKKLIKFPLWDYNWDKLENKGKDEEEMKHRKRTLLLIRHGDYHKGDRKSENYGHLNEKGVEQARQAGARLKELIEGGLKVDKFIVSTMPRAQESFEAISESVDTSEIEVIRSDVITEGYPCVPDPPSSNRRTEHQVWEDGARFEAGFRKLFRRPTGCHDDDKYYVVVCHANLIRFLVMRALQLPEQAWLRFSLKNASFTQVDVYESGKVSVLNFGEQAHVED